MVIKEVHPIDLENLSGELKEEHPGDWTQPFGYNYLSWTWPWGAVPAGSGLRHVTYDNWIQAQPLYVSVIVLGGRSPQHGFAEINHAAIQILARMSALPGDYCECADELHESHPLLSGPVVAPVFGEPCSWCPWAPLDFWLSEQTAAGKKRRQVVCKILCEARGSEHEEAINDKMFTVRFELLCCRNVPLELTCFGVRWVRNGGTILIALRF